MVKKIINSQQLNNHSLLSLPEITIFKFNLTVQDFEQ